MANKNQIVAAFVFRFTKYIQVELKEDHKDRLTISVHQNDRLLSVLKELLSNKVRNEKVIHVEKYDPAKKASIIVLEKPLDKKVTSQCGCLSIGLYDQPNGEIILLYEKNNRLQFEVNLTVAKQNSIYISSRLLKLASKVH